MSKPFWKKELKRIKTSNKHDPELVKEYKHQYRKQGFHAEHLFDLQHHLAELILPRLIAFRAQYKQYHDESSIPFDEIIDAFELILKEYKIEDLSEEESKDRQARIDQGLLLFAQHFQRMWD